MNNSSIIIFFDFDFFSCWSLSHSPQPPRTDPRPARCRPCGSASQAAVVQSEPSNRQSKNSPSHKNPIKFRFLQLFSLLLARDAFFQILLTVQNLRVHPPSNIIFYKVFQVWIWIWTKSIIHDGTTAVDEPEYTYAHADVIFPPKSCPHLIFLGKFESLFFESNFLECRILLFDRHTGWPQHI